MRGCTRKRGREARLGYLGRVLLEHRAGLIMKTMVTPPDGHGERDAAVVMVERVPGRHRITVAADKGYDTATQSPGCASHGQQHIAQHVTGRRGAIDGRTTRHLGYATSQEKRKLVEQRFGWMKTISGLRKLRHRGGRCWSAGSLPSTESLQWMIAAEPSS